MLYPLADRSCGTTIAPTANLRRLQREPVEVRLPSVLGPLGALGREQLALGVYLALPFGLKRQSGGKCSRGAVFGACPRFMGADL